MNKYGIVDKEEFDYENNYTFSLKILKERAGKSHPTFKLEDGSKIYRPLSFKEGMIATCEQPELFKYHPIFSTGVLHKQDSSLIKLIPICKELITLDSQVNKGAIDNIITNYDSFDVEELDVFNNSNEEIIFAAMGGENKENKAIYNDWKKVIFEEYIKTSAHKSSEREQPLLQVSFYKKGGQHNDIILPISIYNEMITISENHLDDPTDFIYHN